MNRAGYMSAQASWQATSRWSRLLFCMAFAAGVLSSSDLYGQIVQSDLWKVDPEGNVDWDPRLRDFTTVGYQQGTVRIPDWAPSVDVTDFGAVPNDGIDDSQAFMDAIEACENGTAVFVPKGRYTILHRIQPDRDHFVLKGEDMYETVLFFPRWLNEAELGTVGYDPSLDWNAPKQKTTGAESGFILMKGGTERSVENLTLRFRDEMKGDHHAFKGGAALAYREDDNGVAITDSWVKNVRIINADAGIMMGGARHISVINLVMENTMQRASMLGTSGEIGFDGHIGINLGKARHCLFHNITFKGKYYHAFDIIGTPF